jgi:glycogen debranching enzyme
MDLGRLTGHLTRRGGLKGAAAVAGAALLPAGGAHAVEAVQADLLESLAIAVPREANRQVIFTNKVSAVWLTQTHANDHPEHAWFAGLNVAKKKVMGDYTVWVGASALDRTHAEVTVWPDRMERAHAGGIVETLRFAEGRVLVEITLAGAPAEADIRLSGDGVRLSGSRDGVRFYQPGDGAPGVLGLARQGDSFLIALEDDESAVIAALADSFATATARHGAQRARLTGLISGDHLFECSDADIQKAVRWMTLTMDRLVMDQGEKPGIYAGLPWFNEYWGRDSFIALPGALLVTGQFETARKILVSFAQYMDMDETSRFYGRVPNIVQPDNLDYHSADGTPRWVLAVKAYVDWSGDTSIVDELRPQLVASVEGALKNWVDDEGFLTHADNETWMDARRQPDLKPYSPRGNRANDVQALWNQQLGAMIWFGIEVPDDPLPQYDRVDPFLASMPSDWKWPSSVYGRPQHMMADRILQDGTQDHAVRPNVLMCRHRGEVLSQMAQVVEECVFPWGVASLSNRHSCFHPYHVAPEHEGRALWHKDEAYHNGAIWQWLNGPAIEGLSVLGRGDMAWTLFSNACHDVLTRGCVGGLAENANAYPLPGETKPRLTGTCLQAWSNSEHLRVLTKAFARVFPDYPDSELAQHRFQFAPKVPETVDSMALNWRLGRSVVAWSFVRDNDVETHRWTVKSGDIVALAHLPESEPTPDIALSEGQSLVMLRDNRGVRYRIEDSVGRGRRRWRHLPPHNVQTANASELKSAFADLDFAKPRPLSEHHSMTGQCRSGVGP